MSFPGCIVARWVRAVKLVTHDSVPASIHEGNTEGATATHLSVDMLLISKVADELLAVNWGSLAVDIPLAVKTAHVNQHICVGYDARNGDQNVIVHLV